MDRNELERMIADLGELAERTGHLDAASVLFALVGSMKIGKSGDLMKHVNVFTQAELRRLKAHLYN